MTVRSTSIKNSLTLVQLSATGRLSKVTVTDCNESLKLIQKRLQNNFAEKLFRFLEFLLEDDPDPYTLLISYCCSENSVN